MSVAVLVNSLFFEGVSSEDTKNAIERLEPLIASAVGFDSTRGDVISIADSQFASKILPDGNALGDYDNASSSGFGGLLNTTNVPMLLVLAALGVATTLLIMRRSSRLKRVNRSIEKTSDKAALPAMIGSVSSNSEQSSSILLSDQEASSSQLSEVVKEKQTETVELLRSWLEDGRGRV